MNLFEVLQPWCSQEIDKLGVLGKWAEVNDQREEHLKSSWGAAALLHDKVKDKTLGMDGLGELEKRSLKLRR